jgi:hypothetical protein
MTELGQGLRLAGKTLGELRILFTLGSEKFQGDETVQRFLTRLVNHSHPAASQAGENVELGKMRGDFLDRRRGQCGAPTREQACTVEIDRREAVRAEAFGCIRWQG